MPWPPSPSPSHTLFLPATSSDAVDLIDRLLVCDPRKRLTCTQVLQHTFFTNAPGPTPAEFLPLPRPVRTASSIATLMPGQAKARRPLAPGGDAVRMPTGDTYRTRLALESINDANE